MENYGSSYPYHDPYRYPSPPPPPVAFPSNSDSYPPPSQTSQPSHSSAIPVHHHAYHPSYPFSYSYPQLPPHPYSSHLGYQYGYPPPSSQYPYHYAYPNPHPYAPAFNQSPPPMHYLGSSSPPPPRLLSPADSLSGHFRQDNSVAAAGVESVQSSSGSQPNIHPPVDHQLGRLRLSDHHLSASSLVPTSSALYHSFGARYDTQTDTYGYPNNSYSSNMDPSYSSQSTYGSAGPAESSQHGQSFQMVPIQPGKRAVKVLLLHGNLDIWIYDARNLPNMDMFHNTLTGIVGKTLPGIEGRVSPKITSDPYVSIRVADAVIGRTFVISNSENPIWLQHFNVPVAHYAAEVHFLVKDSDIVGSQFIGIVAIPVEHLISGDKIQGSFPILNTSGKPCKLGAELRISIQYIPIERLTFYQNGVGSGPNYPGVPGTYFPLRKGGKVTLYQDAHVPDGCLPDLKLDHGKHYEHGQCWHDICDAISQARRLVYIAGWSVYHKVRLIRDAGFPSDYTLGDLLKSKSREGVRVLLLVWDDPTSRNILGYKTDGVMGTHDEETRRFLKHSSVRVLLTPRSAGKRHSWAKQQEVGTIYTHHQKTVIVDTDAGRNMRRIIAFVGGLDLCDGRYDTPRHSLFRTLHTVHEDDYHNPTFAGSATTGCPRQPWHDMHCRIDGPAAYDVLTNFEERWLKASKNHGIKKLKKNDDDALLIIERIPDIVGMFEAPSLRDNDPEAWHIQIFRSIDSNSVKRFPKDPKEATNKNLVCGKNVLIDMSIHTAYVKAIRAAQHFIYIENQYFLGSSYNWASYKDLGANNIIPMEISLKIANKIRANERFVVYIVVPMWPEGVPTGTATQRILFWQHKTMQMMYQTIYKALEEVGLEKTFVPEDYLNFFCLGNREVSEEDDDISFGGCLASNTPQALTQKSRRFMIYVHSKGMIVDDEYVILGSANINQRSMEGTRDTEIAMGAYQPQYTWAKKAFRPRGQVYGYRMSLWAEHIGALEECFTEPESLDCVRRIRSLGESNWAQFAADEVTEMRGHLIKYPVKVDPVGKVKPIPGCESFLDVGGNILGTFFAIQENLTI